MSEFAYIRFLSLSLLTEEEKENENKNEIIEFTEQVLDAEGIECDSKISKVSEEKLKEILEKVRKIRKKRRKNYDENETSSITVVDERGN
jgi:predicted secreted Zn-dependent protease